MGDYCSFDDLFYRISFSTVTACYLMTTINNTKLTKMNLLCSLILLRVYAEVKYETYMLLVALNYLIMAAFSLLQFYTIFLAYSHWIDKKDGNRQPLR